MAIWKQACDKVTGERAVDVFGTNLAEYMAVMRACIQSYQHVEHESILRVKIRQHR